MTAAGADRASLAGATAVVVGASRGIGEAVARSLAGAGAGVALVARSSESLDRIAAEIGGRAFAVRCDVRDGRQVDAAIDTIGARFGPAPAILVNSAGLFSVGPIRDLVADDFESMLNVNLVTPVRFIRGFLPAMIASRRGHIVTIGSVAGHSVFPGNAAYAATKHGARAVHEVLRTETKGTGVRATLISPAATDTALWDELDPDAQPDMPSRSEMLKPQDVAAAVLFSLMQGPTVNVDEIRLSHA